MVHIAFSLYEGFIFTFFENGLSANIAFVQEKYLCSWERNRTVLRSQPGTLNLSAYVFLR